MYSIGLDTSALDTSFKNHALRGIGRYVQELHRYLKGYSGAGLQVGSFDQTAFKEPSLALRCIDALPAGKRTLSQQILYPLRLRKGALSQFDAVHFPAHMDAPAWSPKRYILTVLDLIPLVLKDLYKADKPTWRFAFARFLEMQAIKNASLIVAISHNTARDVHRMLGVPEDRIVVTHLGVDRKFFDAQAPRDLQPLLSRYRIPSGRPLVLYVGGIDQRKNAAGLLHTFSILKCMSIEQGQIAPVLLMAGNIQSDAQYTKVEHLIKVLGLEADVVTPGFVDDSDLLQLYATCAVFFFPSLYEGFGLPPLEAMAAGAPVVSSGTSSMPEVLGDAALMVDPNDFEQAARELFAVLHTSELSQRLKSRGPEQAKLFTWSKTGEQTLAAYERLAAQAQGA